MKKIGLLFSLLTCSILLTGCFEVLDKDRMIYEIDEPEIETINTYTGKYLALYPFGTEIKIQEPDYSWMTVQKLYNDPNILRDKNHHCGKDIYFLNSVYYKAEFDDEGKYKSEEKLVIQEEPTKEPLYFDWELYQNVWNTENTSLDHLEGNILLTGYLENYIEPDCIYCDEEEQKEAGKVEVWRIRPDDGNQYGGFVLGYTEGNHIVTIYPNIRFDDIECFNSYNKCTDHRECVNLRDIANDWKIHTFRVVFDDGGSQERAYFGSMVRERDFIE